MLVVKESTGWPAFLAMKEAQSLVCRHGWPAAADWHHTGHKRRRGNPTFAPAPTNFTVFSNRTANFSCRLRSSVSAALRLLATPSRRYAAGFAASSGHVLPLPAVPAQALVRPPILKGIPKTLHRKLQTENFDAGGFMNRTVPNHTIPNRIPNRTTSLTLPAQK